MPTQTRRDFLRLCGAGAGALALGQGLRAAETPLRPLNFLWLIGDDAGPALGCYGTKEVWSPHLDQLAAEGVRYTHFYTTAPVCSPSRSAFMTGMYQTTIGAHNHRSHRGDGFRLPDGVRVLTEWFRDAGYYTANITTMPEGVAWRGTGKTDWNFEPPAKPFDTNQWSDLKAHQPFFAQINYIEPHHTFKAPKRADPAKVDIPPYYPDHPVTRADMAAYLDSMTALDGKVGEALAQLEKDGLADTTVIIFFGDNGEPHVRGKQFVYEEGLIVPLIIRWPKGLTPPAGFKPGTVDERLLMAIDLAPTMLDLAGAKVPEKMEGRVFLGARAGPPRQYTFGARDRCDETVFRLRTVRDNRYRHIRNFTPDRPFLQKNDYKERQYPVWTLLKELHDQGKLTPAQEVLCAPTMPEEELYDLQEDPHEIRNLAKLPEHEATLKRLRAALEKWIEETNDQGKTLEPPDVAANKGGTGRDAPVKQGKKGKAKNNE
jgi:arylsulfatase A-like enzyme